MNSSQITIQRLTNYSLQDAKEIGRLMPFLSTRQTDAPMPKQLLKEIISSPYHEQIVARLDGKIVGTATLNILMGPAVKKMGYLEDFVTDPKVRMGIGNKIWDEIAQWCNEHEVDISFTSKPERQKAHDFYLSHGAVVRESTVFRVPFKDKS